MVAVAASAFSADATLATSVVVWWMIIFSFWVVWIYVVIRVFIDNFARKDHGGWAKAMWTILIIFLPVIGVCSYLIACPSEEVVV